MADGIQKRCLNGSFTEAPRMRQGHGCSETGRLDDRMRPISDARPRAALKAAPMCEAAVRPV